MNYPYEPKNSFQFLDYQNRNCCKCKKYKITDTNFFEDSCELEEKHSLYATLAIDTLTPEEKEIMFSEPLCKARDEEI